MKSFKDIDFKPHRVGEGFQGLIFFENGYGMSVVRFKNPLTGDHWSYTSTDDEWEVAILHGHENDWEITYYTPITDDVLGYLTEGEVDWVMIQVQELPS